MVLLKGPVEGGFAMMSTRQMLEVGFLHVSIGICRTLVYSVKCPIHMWMEMGPKISLCPIPLQMESMKFHQRSDPFCVHKWLSVARSDPCAYILWLLTNLRSCIPKILTSHHTYLPEPDLQACTCVDQY